MSQIYHSLMTLAHPATDPFDAHILACAMAQTRLQSAELGLTKDELTIVLQHHFPLAVSPDQSETKADTWEEPDLRHLLRHNATDPTNQTTQWLAKIIARRCQAPRHLWQDLGLPQRSDLTNLMRRHFGPLHALNDRDMKWKKFLYRMLCQMDGLLVCKSPVCDQCTDYDICFGGEDA